MRIIGLMAVAALTACSGASENKNKAASADGLQPGQYEVVAEATQFRQADEGEAAFNMAVGTRETRSVCVADAASPDLFAPEGLTCQPGASAYMRAGTISSSYRCTAAGRTGDIALVIEGTFTGDGFEVTRNMRTAFSGDGDIVADARLTGRRTGACSAAPAAGSNSAAPVQSN